jgi:hypothetical protein
MLSNPKFLAVNNMPDEMKIEALKRLNELMNSDLVNNFKNSHWLKGRLTNIIETINLNSDAPKKIYISRRSHLHNNTQNMGTNYTTRRRCINEDEVVDLFCSHDYKEIFCENLTTDEKISLFARATHVAGFIGGGMANLLFSNPATIVTCIETPEFLKINQRFIHSMDHTKITYLPITAHSPFEGPWPLYVRVKVKDTGLIGETEEWCKGVYKIKIAEKPVAGFSLSDTFIIKSYSPDELEPLDGGLNSPFICDIESLRIHLESLSDSAK